MKIQSIKFYICILFGGLGITIIQKWNKLNNYIENIESNKNYLQDFLNTIDMIIGNINNENNYFINNYNYL